MNQHIFQGKWRQMRGSLKSQWGKLTDDDVRRIQGALDQAVGIIQQRYGYTRERAQREIDEYLDSYSQQVQSYSDRLKAYGEQLDEYGEQLKRYNQDVQAKLRQTTSGAAARMRQETAITEQAKPSSRGRAWMAIMAGMALFALVLYLFNQQERTQESLGYSESESQH